MKVIQVGSVVIISHDNYWKIKDEIRKYEDMISRGLGVKSEVLETPFAKSCGCVNSTSSEEFLFEMREAVRLFELEYPVKIKVFGEVLREFLNQVKIE